MTEAWIIDAARTPRGIGKVDKGALSNVHPQRILSTVFKALSDRNGVNTAEIDDVIAGCGSQRGKQGACIARMAALDAEWDVRAPGVTLDRFCGSGMTSVNFAATSIMAGMDDLIVAGGVESMSHVATLDNPFPFFDKGNKHLRRLHPQIHQGVCADVIATLEGITREEADALAVESQRRADAAIKAGHFDNSLVPVYHDDGTLALATEEFPRPNTTMESLAGLKPSFAGFWDRPIDEDGNTFKKDIQGIYPGLEINHIHHAGNSSGVVDGAAALLLASPDYARAQGWKPRARIRAMAHIGDSPELMLNAPGPAAQKVLKRAGMTLSDIELFEINEAFAVVPLKFMRDLDIDPAIVNVNGGAMALGHPIGATGAIILGTLLDEMERRDLTVGMATMCAAGGMAPAIIIERI